MPEEPGSCVPARINQLTSLLKPTRRSLDCGIARSKPLMQQAGEEIEASCVPRRAWHAADGLMSRTPGTVDKIKAHRVPFGTVMYGAQIIV
jgi:hypothetical protein